MLLINRCFLLLVFFFQAEDGIRDRNVTGVQTCALPIFVIFKTKQADNLEQAFKEFTAKKLNREERPSIRKALSALKQKAAAKTRSEERRVGKECRSRWATGE